jgi:hypothetical protein
VAASCGWQVQCAALWSACWQQQQRAPPPPLVEDAPRRLSDGGLWLSEHNKYRCMHNAAPLTWDDDLAAKAAAWAAYLQTQNKFVHSDSYAYPDNLAKESASGAATGITAAYPSSGEVAARACVRTESGVGGVEPGVRFWRLRLWIQR